MDIPKFSTITEEAYYYRAQLKTAQDLMDRFSFIIAEQEKELKKLNDRCEKLTEENKKLLAQVPQDSRLRDLQTKLELADARC